jgi:hypothetical protein
LKGYFGGLLMLALGCFQWSRRSKTRFNHFRVLFKAALKLSKVDLTEPLLSLFAVLAFNH